MAQDWIASFEALKDVYINDAFSNIAINEAIGHHPGCSVGFVRAFVKGVLRDSLRLDFYVENLAKNGLKGIKKRTLIVIKMGLYAIESLDSVPEYAAVNESVVLAKKVSRGSDRFVNAILRSFVRRKNELIIDEKDLCLRYSFPENIVSLIRDQYGEDAENIIKALYSPAPMVIRTNLLKTTRTELIKMLNSKSIKAMAIEESRSAILCDNGSVISTEEFENGLFSVQSLSSILAIEALNPKSGSFVLDMCAAPGGKTAAIAELMNNDGKIVSCDIYEHRLDLIDASCKRLGVTIDESLLLDGTEYNSEFYEKFDYVIADVPCSGLGVIAGKPELKYRTDADHYDELTFIQKKILQNAIRYTKPGGIIQYSTCTINKKENEDVIESAIDEGSLVQILEKKTYLPYNNKIGFFYSIIRKSASITMK